MTVNGMRGLTPSFQGWGRWLNRKPVAEKWKGSQSPFQRIVARCHLVALMTHSHGALKDAPLPSPAAGLQAQGLTCAQGISHRKALMGP